MPTACWALPCVPSVCGVPRVNNLLTLVAQQDQVSLVTPWRPLLLLSFFFLPDSPELLLVEGGRMKGRQGEPERSGGGGLSCAGGVWSGLTCTCRDPVGGLWLWVPAACR